MRLLNLCLFTLLFSGAAKAQTCQDLFHKKTLPLEQAQQVVYSAITYQALMNLEQKWREILSPDFKWTVDQGFSKYEYEAIAELIYSEMVKSVQVYRYDFETAYGLRTLIETTPRSQIIRELSYLIYGLQHFESFPQLPDQLNVSPLNRHTLDRAMDQTHLVSLSAMPLFTAGVTIGAIAFVLGGDTNVVQAMDYAAYGLAGTGLVSAVTGLLGMMGITMLETSDPLRVSTLKRYKLKRLRDQLQRFYQFSKENFEKLPADDVHRLDLTPLYDSMVDHPLIPQQRSSGGRLPIII